MFKAFVISAALFAAPVLAQEKSFTLQAPFSFNDSGFLRYLLPRFSLKTGIKIHLLEEGGLARFGEEGTPVFREGARLWRSLRVVIPPLSDLKSGFCRIRENAQLRGLPQMESRCFKQKLRQ